jgi:hypothetical protein
LLETIDDGKEEILETDGICEACRIRIMENYRKLNQDRKG